MALCLSQFQEADRHSFHTPIHISTVKNIIIIIIIVNICDSLFI